LIFCSGQIAIDPAVGKLVEADVAAQTRRVMQNLEAVLAAAGATFADVVKTTIFLVDMADFAIVNPIYGERFAGGVAPARSTVAVAMLPLGARIEIEAIARRRT
jgi:2-iminobutanoate/2-iminopropanoate deaminase